MIFGAFFPLVLVVVLGLLVAIIVLVREIRKILGTSGETGSKNPPLSLAREFPYQEHSARYKKRKRDEPQKQPQETKSEKNPTSGAVWRW
ncbi:MAG: hypothetical protein FJ004_06930 [Chloroflexi bacterium]|nr:hypothetical protein [Chloroflexota bacterium]